MTLPVLSQETCKNCGHAMHWHNENRGQCGFCQTSPQVNCSCQRFQFPDIEILKGLPKEEIQKLACAAYLGINPVLIKDVKLAEHHNQHIGLYVTVYIFTGEDLNRWIGAHLPNNEDWVVKYVQHLKKHPRR